jgi:MFS family permease
VHGVTPTSSGLRLLPLMAGVLSASILSGRLISKFGRYKVFPVVGTALTALGMFLLSQLGPHTSFLLTYVYMAVLGVGLGFVMQVLILVVQNSVDYRNLGVATSTATFFRSIGGSFGVAIFGTIFANRLGHWLPRLVPHSVLAHTPPSQLVHATPAQLMALPPNVHEGLIDAISKSLNSVFLWATPVCVLAFVLTLFLREVPLRGYEASDPGITAAEAA